MTSNHHETITQRPATAVTNPSQKISPRACRSNHTRLTAPRTKSSPHLTRQPRCPRTPPASPFRPQGSRRQKKLSRAQPPRKLDT
ncbi:hypothetical protein EJ06DRAFT_530959 [Trichodelitschia bisporula]|uniref:Uncharacterized protein n=1 Tax=Trichodelitschia bisporula TaxID=703511 RepID=A0A6G1HTN4_9PEZI|nr:hypothetical protein EJ06DRAFT_530959 [Trichodelitschia bisporula]